MTAQGGNAPSAVGARHTRASWSEIDARLPAAGGKQIIAYVGLGSNLGEREANLREASERLARTPGVRLLRSSGRYESEPVGVTDQPWFLNSVAEVATTLAPLELLRTLKSIETQIGRVPGRHWGERLIDLDLLLYGDRRVDSAALTVPHPEMWRRLFVLRPLAELVPDHHAPDGRPIRQLMAELERSQQVRLLVGRR